MCFSATASFVAGGTLCIAGIFTLRRAKTPARVPLASMPFLLGVQQLIEGVVWMSFGQPLINSQAAFVFTLFSHVLWPSYMPLALLMIEPNPRRKRLLSGFFVIGVGISLYLLYCVLKGPVTASVVQNCISYQVPTTDSPLGLLAYLLVTCASCLVSSHRYMKYFGAALFLALLISLWSYHFAYYSVWCFFAAILSLIIYFFLGQKEPAATK